MAALKARSGAGPSRRGLCVPAGFGGRGGSAVLTDGGSAAQGQLLSGGEGQRQSKPRLPGGAGPEGLQQGPGTGASSRCDGTFHLGLRCAGPGGGCLPFRALSARFLVCAVARGGPTAGGVAVPAPIACAGRGGRVRPSGLQTGGDPRQPRLLSGLHPRPRRSCPAGSPREQARLRGRRAWAACAGAVRQQPGGRFQSAPGSGAGLSEDHISRV